MYKIASVGDKDSVFVFGALGCVLFICETTQQAMSALKEISNGEYAIVFITEKLYLGCLDEVADFEHSGNYSIIPIPGVSENNGIGMKRVSGFVERAVGSDIVSNV